MTDRPILFSAPMVRALLDGRKTQTRRVLKPQVVCHPGTVPSFSWGKFSGLFPDDWFGYGNEIDDALPYRAGDRLWVREAHHRTNDSTDSHLVGYDFSDGPIPREGRHHVEGVGDVQFFCHSLGGWGGRTSRNYPGIHMPRWASRLTLTVADVRVQRLQEISEADAQAEGVEPSNAGFGPDGPVKTYRTGFVRLWNSINSERGFGWLENPWVVAITFTVERRNIDQVAAPSDQDFQSTAGLAL